jgi:serine protease Do
MTKKSLSLLRLSALMLGGTALFLGTGFALSPASNGNEAQNAPLHVQVDSSPLVRNAQDATSFAPIVKKVAPSVVKVFVTMKATDKPMSKPDMDFFRRFFEGEELNQINPGQEHAPTEHGLGSGVIVSPDGYS